MRRLTPHLGNLLSANQFFYTLTGGDTTVSPPVFGWGKDNGKSG